MEDSTCETEAGLCLRNSSGALRSERGGAMSAVIRPLHRLEEIRANIVRHTFRIAAQRSFFSGFSRKGWAGRGERGLVARGRIPRCGGRPGSGYGQILP